MPFNINVSCIFQNISAFKRPKKIVLQSIHLQYIYVSIQFLATCFAIKKKIEFYLNINIYICVIINFMFKMLIFWKSYFVSQTLKISFTDRKQDIRYEK